jgi:H-type lectin domain
LKKGNNPVIFHLPVKFYKQKFEGAMKKLISAVFVVLFLGLFTLTFSQPKFVTGKYTANTNDSGFSLDKNTGPRTFLLEVNFLNPFESRPEVLVTVNVLDADKATNVRYNVEATAISRDGFTVKITTWDDSRIYGIGGNWIAYVK